jgi:foldase protein PrsA
VNKSKKIKKVTAEVQLHDKTKDKVVSSKILTVSSIILVVLLIGALLFDQLYEAPLLTVDGEKYKLKDLAFYFYTVEAQYESYDQIFGGSGAYWDMTSDDITGTTMRDAAKETAINTALYNEVLYNQATSEGYTSTEEEIKVADESAAKLIDESLSKEVIAKNHFSKELLSKMLSKASLVDRYRRDRLDALNIDKEAIKAGVSFEEYKQYDVEYLFVTTSKTDEEGKTTAMTDQEKADALAKLKSYIDKAKTTEDWSKLLPEDEKTVTYKKSSFIKSDTTFEDALKTKLMAMSNGQITDVYEGEDGYYLVRMINNNSSERYDSEVESAIEAKEKEEFEKIYADILKEHEYKINYDTLKTLRMGTLTLAK